MDQLIEKKGVQHQKSKLRFLKWPKLHNVRLRGDTYNHVILCRCMQMCMPVSCFCHAFFGSGQNFSKWCMYNVFAHCRSNRLCSGGHSPTESPRKTIPCPCPPVHVPSPCPPMPVWQTARETSTRKSVQGHRSVLDKMCLLSVM